MTFLLKMLQARNILNYLDLVLLLIVIKQYLLKIKLFIKVITKTIIKKNKFKKFDKRVFLFSTFTQNIFLYVIVLQMGINSFKVLYPITYKIIIFDTKNIIL